MTAKQPVIGLVGPCKSGKSVLKVNLEQHGYPARHIAQEHSFAPRMWQQIARPDVLIYLNVSFNETVRRGQQWLEQDYLFQLERLQHARKHADLIVDTSKNSPEVVLQTVLEFLQNL